MSAPLVERARRLFEFLGRAQQLKTTQPRTIDSYQRDGTVLWLADAPVHDAVQCAHRGGDPAPDDPLLVIDRVARVDPPAPDDELAPWVTDSRDDPEQAPQLRSQITVVEPTTDQDPTAQDPTAQSGEAVPRRRSIDEFPGVEQRYHTWLADWQAWAEQELRNRPVREYYGQLFSARVKAENTPEEYELVAGVGLLTWHPSSHQQVKRHLFTAAVTIHFDENTARLTVAPAESPEALKTELDMLDPGLITTPERVDQIRSDARALNAHPLHRDEVGALARRLVHTLDANGEYRDDDAAPASGTNAAVAYAPAIILRKRSQQGLVDVFQTIVNQLIEADEVPDGIIPLLDPDHMPQPSQPTDSGAIVTVDDEPFLPMPVNDKQLQIIRQVDSRAQVLVQGPPGTGKTHTAAALLSHLLVQGKRVLVTAHTDRALYEVRDKLPEQIKPLVVSVVGTSRDDMADLKVAVQTIAAAAHEHDSAENAEQIERCLQRIDNYRRQRADLNHRLLACREREVRVHDRGPYRGTLAAIARQHQASAAQCGWLLDYARVGADEQPPMSTPEIAQWHGYLLDVELNRDEPESRMRLLDLATVPSPDTFANLVDAEREAVSAGAVHEPLKSHPAFEAVLRLDGTQREQLRRRLEGLAGQADALAGRREQWLGDALSAVYAGRAGEWQARGDRIAELIEQCTDTVSRLGALIEVTMPEGDTGRMKVLADEVRRYLQDGGKIKILPDGSPKIGAFAAKVLKHGQPLFDAVRVNGLPPTNPQQLDVVITWIDARRTLAALDRAWPENVHIPPEDTLHERLQWHKIEYEQLRRLLQLGDELGTEACRLAELELPAPDWEDLSAVRAYASVVDAAAAEDAWTAAAEPLRTLAGVVDDPARWSDAAPAVAQLQAAVHDRDHNGYVAAYRRLERLWHVRALAQRRNELGARLARDVPDLFQAVATNPADGVWDSRLATFDEAWAWASVGSWIREQEETDINELQLRLGQTEDDIREQVEVLAARRAWDHAASPDRLSGKARADLTQYAQLVQRLGKGTGKYTVARKAEIRQAMDRCRPSVPVWIMPLYRIADQLRIAPDMFDVVIVDEASQAGLEATFLQYLARKIVVIGDDKQVSPSAVGIDQQQLRDLAGQYLAHDRYRASWQDPKRSLFDEAKMRYGGVITLTEHRRCVPEIIGFSNRVAYEPDGVRLLPVRQYGADRLEPIKAVYLADGYQRGSTSKVNPVEVDAIADQIEKCIADPAYDGKTFGVLSLLGAAQAKQIEAALLDRLPPEEWEARKLRCGDAADFQGSERDVMFLSMVAAPEPGRRIAALTQDANVQRFNVAVSRARDQVWVFHSVERHDLTNQDDMRFALLDYCYGVIERGQSATTGGITELVPENETDPRFDSLFEQRVHNRLIDRGYSVIPQYEAMGYRIDLVVVGGSQRLAVECDGDHWHGPEAFQRDLARQRELERCGWRFFRIRESAFYTDPAGTLGALWTTLRELDIHPAGGLEDATRRNRSCSLSPRQ
jgi:very-short-patch-repair endonuclease/DNA polymerase III delta prime subunit